jgi:heme/copper-type cytochrome/quinol oxidase subunit 2
MITFLTVLFFIFSALLIFVVVYQYRIKNTLKGRQSPEKEKLLNWLVTGIGVIFFVVVFLLAFTYNRMAIEEKSAVESVSKSVETQTAPATTQPATSTEQTNRADQQNPSTNNTESPNNSNQ